MAESETILGVPFADLLPAEFAAIDWRPALPTIASPSWSGGDSFFYEGRSDAGAWLLVRCLRPAAVVRSDVKAMFTAMRAAGEAGLGPKIHYCDSVHALCVEDKLDASWQPATLYRLLDAAAWRALLDVRRRVHQLDVRLPQVTVFEQIDALLARVHDDDIELPSLADDVIPMAEEVRACLRGGPAPVPCHGDGAVSNVALRGEEAVLLGWTQAGSMDPLEELGSVLTELVPFVADADAVFTAAWGERDPQALARARLYGFADDLRWGLIGTHARALQADSPIEYQRYGSWRLFKANLSLVEGDVERWMKEAR